MSNRFHVLVLGDVLLSMLAIYSGFTLRSGEVPSLQLLIYNGGPLFLVVIVIAFSSFLAELYNRDKRYGKKELLAKVSISLLISFFVLSSFFYMLPFARFGRAAFMVSLGIFGLYQFLWHVGYRAFINSPGLSRGVIVLGVGPLARHIGEIVTSTNHQHVLRGYINVSGEPLYVPSHAIVGNGGGIIETARKEKAQKIVVSLSERRGVFPLQDVLDCKFSGIQVMDATSFYEDVTGKLLIENLTPSCFIFSEGFNLNSYVRIYKRIFDLFFSFLALLLVLPLIPLIALLIKIDSPGSILFRQARVGEKERIFNIYKFRTMREDAENNTGAVWAKKHDPRITRIGRLLRKTRVDEIPQLYNVLKGDMSFIGPRPERPEFVKALKVLIPFYSERHFVKPGITGWAQARYSYGASFEDAFEKLRYDLYYIKHMSLFLDMLVMIETVNVVLFGRGSR